VRIVDQNIDPIVERLERSLMPHFADFAAQIMRSDRNVLAQTFSNRHLPFVHVFGVSCRPIGTEVLDPTSVALVVSITAIKRLQLFAYITWQLPPACWTVGDGIEARTPVFHRFNAQTALKFEHAVRELLPELERATRQGRPKTPRQNQIRRNIATDADR
jgi:hypothetical protein